MGRRARLHTNETGGKLAEELHHLLAAQLPNEHDLALTVDAVNLENVLGEINANGANLHVDDPLSDSLKRSPYGTSMPERASSTPSFARSCLSFDVRFVLKAT